MVKDSSYTLAGVRVGEEDGIPFVETEGTEDFDLRAVMECGQCFRWLPGDDGSYTGVVGRNVITLRADGDDLLVAGLDQAEAE